MNVGKEIAMLKKMTVAELRRKYAEVFGEATRAANKDWLVKRIAWRMQALAEGDLSERARRRAAELANDADLRMTPPKTAPATVLEAGPKEPISFKNENRVPPPGTILVRKYKGRRFEVTVLTEGFEYDGQVFKSLSAVAKAITGQHCNGFHFFRIEKEATQ
jgi:Protein of unknown function (DUF2924)